MIDVLKAVGPDAMAQVVLGQRRYRSRYPADPGSASRGLLQAVEHRSGRASLRGGAEYLGAGYCLQPTSPPGKTRYRSAARGVASLGPLGLHEGRPSLRTNPAQPAPVRRGP